MIGLLQRITNARVEIKGEIVAAVGAGLLVLLPVLLAWVEGRR